MTVNDNPNFLLKQAFVNAVFSGDHASLRRLADPEFELHEGSGLPFAGLYRGAEGFIEFLHIFNTSFEIQRLEETMAYSCDDPDQMAFQFELEAVLPGTKDNFKSTLVELWQFRDGKVLKIVPHYFNSPFQP
jgi:ketosteroid isomerase-like protein